jgi:hypothetical protein
MPEVAPPAPTTQLSNAAEITANGLDSVGEAPEQMGLSGSFASTILDCMPLIASLPMAKAFSNNPSVVAWASEISLNEALVSLRSAANSTLENLWPIGTGFSAETQMKGQFLEGLNGVAHMSALRTDGDTISLSVDGIAGVGLSGGGPGVSVSDAFGQDVATMMAGAGLDLEVRYVAKKKAEFDVLSLLGSAALLSWTLADIIPGGVGLDLPSMFSLRQQSFQDGISDTAEWDISTEMALMAKVEGKFGTFSQDMESEFVNQSIGAGAFSEVVKTLLPTLAVCAAGGLLLREEADKSLVVEGEANIGLLVGSLGSVPMVADLLPPSAQASLEGMMGASGEARVRLVFSYTDSLALNLDSKKSGFMASASEAEAGQQISIERFLSFANLSALNGVADGQAGSLALAMDLKKTVNLEVDARVLKTHAPALSGAIEMLSEGLLDSESKLSLAAEASLSAAEAQRILGPGFQAPEGLMMAALDLAVTGCMPSEAALVPFGESITRLSQAVDLSGARLVGHVHCGVGGGVSVTVGAKMSGVIRAEGGLLVDMPIDGVEADRVLAALGGGRVAA